MSDREIRPACKCNLGEEDGRVNVKSEITISIYNRSELIVLSP